MKLAINLLDLDRIPLLIRQILLSEKLDTINYVITDKSRFDEVAVVFTCDLLTAACICDTIRGYDRRAKVYPTRVYVQKAKAWVRVPHGVMLAVVDGERVLPNPNLFPLPPVIPSVPEVYKVVL